MNDSDLEASLSLARTKNLYSSLTLSKACAISVSIYIARELHTCTIILVSVHTLQSRGTLLLDLLRHDFRGFSEASVDDPAVDDQPYEN